MTLKGLRKLIERAERDARLLDGRDFKARRWVEAYRLLDMLEELEAKKRGAAV